MKKDKNVNPDTENGVGIGCLIAVCLAIVAIIVLLFIGFTTKTNVCIFSSCSEQPTYLLYIFLLISFFSYILTNGILVLIIAIAIFIIYNIIKHNKR